MLTLKTLTVKVIMKTILNMMTIFTNDTYNIVLK